MLDCLLMTESFSSCCDSLIHFVVMRTSRKFAHDDLVKVIKTGETGIVSSFHQDENGSADGVQLGTGPATETAVPEDDLELVKIANGSACVMVPGSCAGFGFNRPWHTASDDTRPQTCVDQIGIEVQF